MFLDLCTNYFQMYIQTTHSSSLVRLQVRFIVLIECYRHRFPELRLSGRLRKARACNLSFDVIPIRSTILYLKLPMRSVRERSRIHRENSYSCSYSCSYCSYLLAHWSKVRRAPLASLDMIHHLWLEPAQRPYAARWSQAKGPVLYSCSPRPVFCTCNAYSGTIFSLG